MVDLLLKPDISASVLLCFSLDVILCGWLGSKYQLTNKSSLFSSALSVYFSFSRDQIWRQSFQTHVAQWGVVLQLHVQDLVMETIAGDAVSCFPFAIYDNITQCNTHRHTHRQTHTQTQTHRHTETHTHTHTHTHIHTETLSLDLYALRCWPPQKKNSTKLCGILNCIHITTLCHENGDSVLYHTRQLATMSAVRQSTINQLLCLQ